MNVQDLKGNVSLWKLTGHVATSSKHYKRPRSKLHIAARKLIAETFPTMQVLEEVPIKIKPRLTLYLDLYLPLTYTAIEVHGEQHYRFNPFYHNTKLDFMKQKRNDILKEEWCYVNGISLITLPYNEDINDWKARLSSTEDE